jgi:transcription antitermination factor NusG
MQRPYIAQPHVQELFYPDPQITSSDEGRREKWHAVYTVARHEKSLARHLSLRNIEHFLPVYCARRRWSDGSRVNIELPLFQGYIFVLVSRRDRVRVLESPGALYFVGGLGKESAEIPAEQIEIFRNGFAKDRTEPHPLLTIGQRVRIVRGALAGMHGILQQIRGGGFRVVVTLELIMRSVAVEIESGDVEMIV